MPKTWVLVWVRDLTNTLACGSVEQILPLCKSTTCIVVLWHSEHLESTLWFKASSFPQEEITNQHGGQLWPEGLWGGFVTARLPVWLPKPSGNTWDGGGEWETLTPPLSNCCWSAHMWAFQIIQWQFSGNTGQLPPNEAAAAAAAMWGAPGGFLATCFLSACLV